MAYLNFTSICKYPNENDLPTLRRKKEDKEKRSSFLLRFLTCPNIQNVDLIIVWFNQFVKLHENAN